MARLRLLLLLLAAVPPWVAPRAAPPDVLADGGRGVVARVIDGDTVRLDGGDADIRLLGLQAPKLPLGRRGFRAWPLADEARAALVELAQGRTVAVRLGETPRDRNGRTLAHLVRDDGLWIQGEMLRRGWARVYTFPDNRALAAEMLALEAEARAARRGIWAHDFYRIRAAHAPELAGDIGTFQIVAGVVRAAARTRERVYLNFDDDFRSDFTVSVEKRGWPRFTRDLLALKGARIEVRGWVIARNGPMIELTHPEQIAVLN
jgi:endonuclease YncB( thermonuclease family)